MTQKIFGLDPESPNIDHDNMLNISGGDSTSNEYYHITETEHTNVERYSPLFDNMLMEQMEQVGHLEHLVTRAHLVHLVQVVV